MRLRSAQCLRSRRVRMDYRSGRRKRHQQLGEQCASRPWLPIDEWLLDVEQPQLALPINDGRLRSEAEMFGAPLDLGLATLDFLLCSADSVDVVHR
jgi:hypothetical protein